jgi:hypothetical protein
VVLPSAARSPRVRSYPMAGASRRDSRDGQGGVHCRRRAASKAEKGGPQIQLALCDRVRPPFATRASPPRESRVCGVAWSSARRRDHWASAARSWCAPRDRHRNLSESFARSATPRVSGLDGAVALERVGRNDSSREFAGDP